MRPATRYLLDTNIISETRRARMDARVHAFLTGLESSALYLSVLTLGELRKGIAAKRRTDAASADNLSKWVDGLERNFADRIIPVDIAVARLWGELSSDRSRPVIDTLIAATALANDMILVTRNGKDVAGLDLTIVDPFTPT